MLGEKDKPALGDLSYGEYMDKQLDVRGIPPKDRHSMIHKAFEELRPGERLTLINDHDPIPLYYEMVAVKADFDALVYTSREEEPDKWVAILKKKDAGSKDP